MLHTSLDPMYCWTLLGPLHLCLVGLGLHVHQNGIFVYFCIMSAGSAREFVTTMCLGRFSTVSYQVPLLNVQSVGALCCTPGDMRFPTTTASCTVRTTELSQGIQAKLQCRSWAMQKHYSYWQVAGFSSMSSSLVNKYWVCVLPSWA